MVTIRPSITFIPGTGRGDGEGARIVLLLIVPETRSTGGTPALGLRTTLRVNTLKSLVPILVPTTTVLTIGLARVAVQCSPTVRESPTTSLSLRVKKWSGRRKWFSAPASHTTKLFT